MSGRLIVIEGTDGSGKSTQLARLCERLELEKIDFKKITFPRYSEQSAALLKMYLNGEFGTSPDCVNAYAASTFFAVDRFASFKMDWQKYYEDGGLIICDRYTTSNAVHQATKLPEGDAAPFLEWLFDFEYQKLGLPKPSCVFFLDMPPDYALTLLKIRQGESGDIHEKDHEYLAKCRARAVDLCVSQNWQKINCTNGDKMRTIDDIHTEIYKKIRMIL